MWWDDVSRVLGCLSDRLPQTERTLWDYIRRLSGGWSGLTLPRGWCVCWCVVLYILHTVYQKTHTKSNLKTFFFDVRSFWLVLRNLVLGLKGWGQGLVGMLGLELEAEWYNMPKKVYTEIKDVCVYVRLACVCVWITDRRTDRQMDKCKKLSMRGTRTIIYKLYLINWIVWKRHTLYWHLDGCHNVTMIACDSGDKSFSPVALFTFIHSL